MLAHEKRFSETRAPILATLLRFVDLGADVLLLIITIALICGILWSESSNAATIDGQGHEVDISNIQSGSLLYQLPDQLGNFAAPVVDTDVQVTISGNIADITISQEFYNPTEQFIEGVYAFPLSENAAVYAMRLQVGDRIIEGRIQEKAQAQKTYENAKKAGKKAGLMQQLRPNLFTTDLANIAAGETVQVILQYQQMILFRDYADQSYYELRIPTAITPRYTPANAGNPMQKVSNISVATDNEFASPVANNVYRQNQEGESNSLNISTKIIASEFLRDIKSVGFPVLVSGPSNNQYEIVFPQTQTADRDYILRWYPEQSEQVRVSLLQENIERENYYLLSLIPPLQGSSGGHALPREVTYIIDVSGSMEGASLQQAKKALALAVSRLRAQDKFNIIKFSDQASALFDQPQDASQDNLSQALHYISDLESEGGTEIESALKLAFSMNSSHGYTGQIIFLTDGGVSNEQQLFTMIENNLGQRRLFTVGIGSAPNNFFMIKAAQFGRGVFTNISDISEVEEKMSALFRQLENPALTDIVIRLEGNGDLEFWPQRVPDLYLGQPLTIAVKTTDKHQGNLHIEGKHGDVQWQADIDLSSALAGKGIARRWARSKIAALMDGLVSGMPEDNVRAAVLPVALKHQLVSNYTSFVAVDVTPVRDQSEGLNSLTYASARPNAAMRLASTATSAPLQLTIGLLLLLLLSLFRLLQKLFAPVSCDQSSKI